MTQKNSGVTFPNGPSLGLSGGRPCAIWSGGGQTGSALTLLSDVSLALSLQALECGALATEEKEMGTGSLIPDIQKAYFLLEVNRNAGHRMGA